MSKRVVIAMSGGVDSSVAAHLLLDQGFDAVGVFMRHGVPPTNCGSADAGSGVTGLLPVLSGRLVHKQGCCSATDAEDARRVAQGLGIPFYAINLQDGFDRIMDYFVSEYVSGRTPNPCVMCNNWLKFGKLFEYADSVGAEYVATGHYAQLSPDTDTGVMRLSRGIDQDKDQSYVLFGVDRKLLNRMLLPVGGFRKTRIREIATGLGLRVADKKDSQEICFVPAGKHAEFVHARKGNRSTSGRILTTSGDVVGFHDGIERYTIGQRKGLGIAMGERFFVIQIDTETNDVVIGSRHELAQDRLEADRLNWLVDLPTTPFRCSVQIRYNSSAKPAVVKTLGDDRIQVVFDEPRLNGVAQVKRSYVMTKPEF